MKKLFWERAFDSVGTDLVTIFIPIYLLKLHYPIQQVLLFYALTGLFMTFLNPVGFASILRFGANRTMVLGNVGNVIFFLLLFALPHWHEPLIALALARGFYSAVYYPAFNANFVAARAHLRTGQQIGLLNAITFVLNGIAPAVGGILAVWLGITWVYIVAVAMIVAGSLPLLVGSEHLRTTTFTIRKIPWRACYRDFLANGLYNIPGFAEMILWPMLISLFIASYAGIGILGSVIIIASIAISLYVGNSEDTVGEKKYINQGVIAGVLGDAGKLLVNGPIGITGVNLISGTASALLASSFVSRYYKNADGEYMLEYTFGMEVTHSVAWVAFFGILTLLATWLSLKEVLLVGIALAIPANLGIRLIRQI